MRQWKGAGAKQGRPAMQNILIKTLHPFLFSILCILVFGLTQEVKSEEKILTVDVEITAPCVMHHNGAYTGFDIELWEEIAQELELAFAYNETDLKGIFTDLVEGSADVAFSCITVTGEREKIIDFSHHYLDSGLRIMVLNKKKFSLAESVKSFYSPIVMKSLTYIGLFIIISGHVFWVVESKLSLLPVSSNMS